LQKKTHLTLKTTRFLSLKDFLTTRSLKDVFDNMNFFDNRSPKKQKNMLLDFGRKLLTYNHLTKELLNYYLKKNSKWTPSYPYGVLKSYNVG
jgi:hypothetical protein